MDREMLMKTKILVTNYDHFSQILKTVNGISDLKESHWEYGVRVYSWLFFDENCVCWFSNREFSSYRFIDYKLIDISAFDNDPLVNWDEVKKFEEDKIIEYEVYRD